MCGTASTTRSPSKVSTSRSVVCVAGCCGPKFKVYKYSRSVESAGSVSARDRGMGSTNHQFFKPATEIAEIAETTETTEITESKYLPDLVRLLSVSSVSSVAMS